MQCFDAIEALSEVVVAVVAVAVVVVVVAVAVAVAVVVVVVDAAYIQACISAFRN